MTTPTTGAPAQIALLQNLLVAGHRPIQMRPGSLLRWGWAFAWLAWSTDPLLRLPLLHGQIALQAAVALAWLGLGLGLTAWLDWRAMHAAAHRADETLPFVYRQVSKVWYLLLAAGILYTVSTFFFGGAYQTYMVWLALVGLGLFLHGLFAQELVEWAGAAIFLMALLVLVAGLPLVWHRPLVICTAGIGMPLLGWLLLRASPVIAPGLRNAGFVLGLLAASIVPAMLWVQWPQDAGVPQDVPVYTRETLQRLGPDPTQWPHHLALHLEAGSPMELQIDMQGGVLKASNGAANASFTLTQTLDFLLIDGQLSHHIRRPGEDWQDAGGWLRITQLDFKPDLTQPGGLKIQSRVKVELQGQAQ
ncbi:MAG: hypothetical protein ACOYNF_19150 [Rhodoferax sp.]